ncbi:hypothetical protein Agub_g5491 [Astrephomene gubernaculifera]|uniref:Rhodanese domain-containing protein n=1 Tax=Astrephomene gubernaculifera TaxID=47775 RepID=A0AAD3HK52_9CHLO|nr:hypothetical protein Agub_g5491 [Astrephomene gubernaculifera]
MRWLWTFGRVPELDPDGILAVSKRIMAMSPSQRCSPSAPRIIDVRTRSEYLGGHIAGALHASFLPPWSWPASIQPLLAATSPASTEIYVICLSAHRSIGALKWLQDRGYKNVRQLKGGMQAWRALALPEVTGGEEREEAGAAPGEGEGQRQTEGSDDTGATGGSRDGKPAS